MSTVLNPLPESIEVGEPRSLRPGSDCAYKAATLAAALLLVLSAALL